jgi:hypothetical protein
MGSGLSRESQDSKSLYRNVATNDVIVFEAGRRQAMCGLSGHNPSEELIAIKLSIRIRQLFLTFLCSNLHDWCVLGSFKVFVDKMIFTTFFCEKSGRGLVYSWAEDPVESTGQI